MFDIGKRNYLAMRRMLWKAGVLLHGEAMGGVRFAHRCALEIAHRPLLVAGSRRAARNWLPRLRGRKEDTMAYRVLIVDDSPAMRAFIRRVIDLSGFELAAASEAVQRRRGPGRCCAANGWMPSSPTSTCRAWMARNCCGSLAADELLRSMPVIVISTDATEQRIERMLALGARGYVTKPFRPGGAARGDWRRTLGVPL